MVESFSSELRRLRKDKGLSLRTVESKTGVSNAYLSQLETGNAENPSPHVLKKLAELYGVPYERLMRLAGYAPPTTESRDVFLSHRSQDKDFVRELAADIEGEQAHGQPLTTWLDEAEIRPGQSIPGMVNDGLEKSRFIAIVMSPDYFKSESGWTDAEWHSALHADPDNRRGRTIPLLISDCPYVPYLLRHLRCIDFRGARYTEGLKELLAVLRDEPVPRPITHRGQLITGSGMLNRATLVAERAVPEADPDPVSEKLYCNLLPIETPPRYIYTAGIAPELIKTRPNGKTSLPSKSLLKEIIRHEQEQTNSEHRYMPAFRTFEERIVTFHDLEDPDGPLAPIIDEDDTEVLDVISFIRDEDLRKVLISLMNMSIVRHAYRGGLKVDDTKQGRRIFFPAIEGRPNVITWTPRKKKATRVVAKPVLKDDKVVFWRHLGAYLQTIFLVNRFYLQISPTWVLTMDGQNPIGGPDIGRRVAKWTGPERNLQVLFHVRFWTSILRQGRGGPIAIRTGDQFMEVATIPAFIQQPWGIAGDQEDLLQLLDEEAPVIAAEEEERVDTMIEEQLQPGTDIEDDELEGGPEIESDADETDEAL